MSKLFDDISRIVGSSMPRRQALKMILMGVVGSGVVSLWPKRVEASQVCSSGFCQSAGVIQCGKDEVGQLCCCPQGSSGCCDPDPDSMLNRQQCCAADECCKFIAALGRKVCVRQPKLNRGALRFGPPVQLDILVQEATRGLSSISVVQATNATVMIPSFTPGTTGQVTVTAQKTDQNLGSSVTLQACSVNGCCAMGDPVLAYMEIPDSGILGQNGKVREKFTAVPQEESFVTIQNGSPGFKRLRIKVNGRTFDTPRLQDNQEMLLDLASELQEEGNSVVLIGYGKAGAGCLITFADTPETQNRQPDIRLQVVGQSPGHNVVWGR
jgi:hypothetical protein